MLRTVMSRLRPRLTGISSNTVVCTEKIAALHSSLVTSRVSISVLNRRYSPCLFNSSLAVFSEQKVRFSSSSSLPIPPNKNSLNNKLNTQKFWDCKSNINYFLSLPFCCLLILILREINQNLRQTASSVQTDLELLNRSKLQYSDSSVPFVDLNMHPGASVFMTYNILDFYASGGDLSFNRLLVLFNEYVDNSSQLKINFDYVQNLSLDRLATLPVKLLELLIIKELRKMKQQDYSIARNTVNEVHKNVRVRIKEVYKDIAIKLYELTRNLQQDDLGKIHLLQTLVRSFSDHTALDKLSLTFEEETYSLFSSPDYEQSIRNLLPEATLHRDIELWKVRFPYICRVIDNARMLGLKDNEHRFKLPLVANLQEVDVVQLVDIRDYFKDDLKIIAFSNNTGEDVSDIQADPFENKPPKHLGIANVILYDPNFWSLVGAPKLIWISETPEKPSSAPGGLAHQYHTILSVTLKNIFGQECIFINTHFSFKQEAHDYSARKLVEHVREVTNKGEKLFIMSGDLNTYPQLTGPQTYRSIYFSGLPIKDWRDDVHAHRVSPELRYATFVGYPYDPFTNKFDSNGNLLPDTLDHIFLHKNIKTLLATKDAGLMDSLSTKSTDQYKTFSKKDLLFNRCTASDHIALIHVSDSRVSHKPSG